MTLHWIVPGSLDQRTGGYLYDARMVEGLRGDGLSVEVHELAGDFPGPGEASARALDQALARVPDGGVVVADGLAMGAFPGVTARHGDRIRLVALVHHPLGDETGLDPARREALLALEIRALEAARGVVVTSPATAARLAELGVPVDRVRAVVPGTAPAPLSTGPDDGAPPRLLSVGTVAPRKGHDVLIRALARVAHLPWTCRVAGSLERDPDWAGRVRGLTAESGLADRIHLLGELEESVLEAEYAGASLFVLPSHYEGYGMALTEALVRGLPVVSTTGGAIPETVPAEAGILLEPGDVEGLAAVLEALLTSPERRETLAAAARAHAAALPDWPAQVRAFRSALEALVDGLPGAISDAPPEPVRG